MPAESSTRATRGTSMRELSHPIVDAMMVYPGDPKVSIEPGLILARDGVAVTQLHFGSHTGTHLDAPSHTVEGGRTTRTITLDRLVGEALVVHLTGLVDHDEYGIEEIAAALGGNLPAQVSPMVVMDTGWAQHFGTHRALSHPHLSAGAARELRSRGMNLLAVDTLSPDPTGPENTNFPVHDVVLGSDGLIVENITALDGLPEQIELGLFPLRIDADGAPVRAVAFKLPVD